MAAEITLIPSTDSMMQTVPPADSSIDLMAGGVLRGEDEREVEALLHGAIVPR